MTMGDSFCLASGSSVVKAASAVAKALADLRKGFRSPRRFLLRQGFGGLVREEQCGEVLGQVN